MPLYKCIDDVTFRLSLRHHFRLRLTKTMELDHKHDIGQNVEDDFGECIKITDFTPPSKSLGSTYHFNLLIVKCTLQCDNINNIYFICVTRVI